MIIKALTFYQPWATLIADGRKTIETRPWSTKHRGRVAIHAGLTVDVDACRRFKLDPDSMPRGLVICTVDLVDVVRIRDSVRWVRDAKWGWDQRNWLRQMDRVSVSTSEKPYGNFHPARYAWLLDDVQQVRPAIRARGKQHLWDLEVPDAAFTHR